MSGTALAPQRVIKLKKRLYRHFDNPMDDSRLEGFSVSPSDVCQHSFMPFLGFTKVDRRLAFNDDWPWEVIKKPREIKYASHRDSAIYAYYADELTSAYEARLSELGISSSALAYRSGIGSNIEFAYSLIQEIRIRRNCVVICLDITKFFDSIDHRRLEKSIINVLGRRPLSKDWIKIFKRMTEYDWVDTKKVNSIFRNARKSKRICSIEAFRKYVRPIIKTNRNPYGIPQGSPLSGCFANVYMLSFDNCLSKYIEGLGGSYRRYSDDIAIVLPNFGCVESVKMAVNISLEAEFLRINDNKTVVTEFFNIEGRQFFRNEPLQYLGFTYDGERVLIRSSSIKKFYARMKSAIRISVRAARNAGYPETEIRKRSLVGRFTHWGDRRNFVQYVYMASRIMNAPEIRRQLRNHVRIFNVTFEKYISEYYHKGRR